tara:strand:+ start:800 stop:922 length:123 start_codon:yes stop_codon:yes gene_type:complete
VDGKHQTNKMVVEVFSNENRLPAMIGSISGNEKVQKPWHF